MKKIFFLFLQICISINIYSNVFFNSDLKVLTTKYFDIIYPEESKDTAKLLFENADMYYEHLSRKYKLEQEYRFPVVLIPNYDIFNAHFSSYGYNRIVMYDTRPSDNLLVYKDDFLKVFYHELTHAINFNIRNKFWYALRSVIGDNSLGSTFIANTAIAEGTAIIEESSSGEGRLNSEFANHIFKQSFIENKNVNFSDIVGVRDVYPSDLNYKFGSKFYQWVYDKFGEEKFVEFWHRCANVKNLTYMGAFKKVYGLSIKKAWKEFLNEEKICGIKSYPWLEEEVELVFNKKYFGQYSDLVKTDEGIIWYDKYNNDILFSKYLTDSKIKFSKPKKILNFSAVENISVSSDNKYLTIDYYDYNKTLPKLKSKIYDLKSKKIFSVKDEGISDSVILSVENEHYFVAIKSISQYTSILIYKIIKDEKDNIKTLDFVKEIDKEFGKNKFSLCDGTNGNLIYLYKDKLDFTIKILDINSEFVQEIIMPTEDTVLQNISYSDSNIYFSYTQKGTLPRVGKINITEISNAKDKDCLFVSADFLTEDYSGGFYNPVVFDNEKIIYIASFFDKQKILKSDFNKLKLENKLLQVKCNYKKNVDDSFDKYQNEISNISKFERKYNHFEFLTRATIIPDIFFNSFSVSSKEDALENTCDFGFGFLLSTLSPYESYNVNLRLGYLPSCGSGNLSFDINGTAPTNLWNYLFNTSIEFDKFGFKQTYNKLNLGLAFTNYDSSFFSLNNLTEIFYGRQFCLTNQNNIFNSFTMPFKQDVIYDKTKRFVLYNKSSLGFGISRKKGINIFETFKLNLSLNFDVFYFSKDNFTYNDVFLNLYPSIKLKVPRILPIPSTNVGCFSLPLEMYFTLLPNQNLLFSFYGDIKLIDIEILKSISWLPFIYFNRIYFDINYAGKLSTGENKNFAIFNLTNQFENLKSKNFLYTDELKIGVACVIRVGLGNISVLPIIMKYDFKFSFYTEKDSSKIEHIFSIKSNY